jgi:nitrate/nitrite-specific signal transduction histidine kinase
VTERRRKGDFEEAAVERVELRVIDDGHGFDADQVSPDHLGLAIMRERAEAIGATLTIESQLGHGTQVIVTWQNEQGKDQEDGIETDQIDNR